MKDVVSTGINLPRFGEFGDVHALTQLANPAASVGWDAFFIWDRLVFGPTWHPIFDPWLGLLPSR